MGAERRGLPELINLPQEAAPLHFSRAAQHVDSPVPNLKQRWIKPTRGEPSLHALLPPAFGHEASPRSSIQQGFCT
jgi:hypothetical protein